MLFKRYDEKGKPYWAETRVSAYKRYLHTIKPIEELIKYLEWERI